MPSSKLTAQIRKQIASNNQIETGNSSVGDFPKELKNYVKENVSAMPDDFLSQLLGVGRYETDSTKASSKPQEMKPGLEFTLSNLKKTPQKEQPRPERRPHVAAGIEYHTQVVRNRERMGQRENQEMQYQIQQIMDELQRLVSSSDKIVRMAYADISVSSAPTIVGKYHTNFFAWMLTVIKTARQKVEESGAWLSVAKGKGSKRGYWNQFKQHGTSFGMSNERTVATQTG